MCKKYLLSIDFVDFNGGKMNWLFRVNSGLIFG